MSIKKLARPVEPVFAASPPYPGQGRPLPAELGLDGAWVIADRIFLFCTDPPGAYGELLGVVLPQSGREAEGFDADILAQHLGMDANRLLLCNQMRQLKFGLKRISPMLSWDVCFRVVVQTPDEGLTYTFGRAHPKGSA
jgi:hypothetical protein